MGKYDKINGYDVKDLPDYVPHQMLKEDNLCKRYEWVENDEVVEFFDLCDTEESK